MVSPWPRYPPQHVLLFGSSWRSLYLAIGDCEGDLLVNVVVVATVGSEGAWDAKDLRSTPIVTKSRMVVKLGLPGAAARPPLRSRRMLAVCGPRKAKAVCCDGLQRR